jgi:hypothetical protein
VTKVGVAVVLMDPFFDPPFGGYRREGGGVRYPEGREKAAGARRQGHGSWRQRGRRGR